MATCPFLPEEHSFILVFFHKNRGLSHNDQFHALLYLYCKGRDYFPIQQIFPYICTMKINPLTYAELSRPMYILEEQRLRENLKLISNVAKEADVAYFPCFP